MEVKRPQWQMSFTLILILTKNLAGHRISLRNQFPLKQGDQFFVINFFIFEVFSFSQFFFSKAFKLIEISSIEKNSSSESSDFTQNMAEHSILLQTQNMMANWISFRNCFSLEYLEKIKFFSDTDFYTKYGRTSNFSWKRRFNQNWIANKISLNILFSLKTW